MVGPSLEYQAPRAAMAKALPSTVASNDIITCGQSHAPFGLVAAKTRAQETPAVILRPRREFRPGSTGMARNRGLPLLNRSLARTGRGVESLAMTTRGWPRWLASAVSAASVCGYQGIRLIRWKSRLLHPTSRTACRRTREVTLDWQLPNTGRVKVRRTALSRGLRWCPPTDLTRGVRRWGAPAHTEGWRHYCGRRLRQLGACVHRSSRPAGLRVAAARGDALQGT